jgi:sigma-E factor negative regulatory protein RseC
MLETRAVVIRIEGQHALVQASGDGCGRCNGNGCGTAALSRLFCSKPRQFQVENAIAAKAGDEVIVSVAESAVLRGIGLVYLLPLALLVAGAWLGNTVAGQVETQESFAVAGALAGLIGGFILSRRIASLRPQKLPCITRHWREE